MIANESIACPICHSPDVEHYFTKVNQGKEYPVYRCGTCGSAMVLPRPTHEEMDTYYSALNYGAKSLEDALAIDSGYFPDSVVDAQRIISHCLTLAKGRSFMDVGAGTGMYSREAIRCGYSVTALEPNPNSRDQFERLNGFPPMATVMSPSLADEYQGSMDVVLLSQVLEHICDLESMAHSIARVLRPGGIAMIAVPHFGSLLSKLQGQRDMYISPPEHVNYFSIKGLSALMTRHGLELAEFQTVTKVPKARFEQKIPLVGALAWRLIYGVLWLGQLFDRGMIINAYFRKVSQTGEEQGLS